MLAPAGLVERHEELLAKQKQQVVVGDLAGAAVTDRCFHAALPATARIGLG